MTFIQSYCRIKNRAVEVDGKQVFTGNGNLEAFAISVYEQAQVNYPKFYKMDNLSKLGFLAAEHILQKRAVENPYSVSVILSNASASLDTDKKYVQAPVASPAVFVYTLPNIVAGEICIRHGIKGESNFFVTPGFEPGLLGAYVQALFANGTEHCLAGWVEVLGEEADVFLYLIGKTTSGLGLEHTIENLNNLYRFGHG